MEKPIPNRMVIKETADGRYSLEIDGLTKDVLIDVLIACNAPSDLILLNVLNSYNPT